MQYSILLILGGTCSATVETWHWYPSFWAAAYFERDNWNSLFRRFNQGWSDWFAFYIVITSDNDPLLAFRELMLVNAIGWIKINCFTVQFNLDNSDWLRSMFNKNIDHENDLICFLFIMCTIFWETSMEMKWPAVMKWRWRNDRRSEHIYAIV